MPIIEGLIQGSDDWLKYRRQHIMATDASIIFGTNPFMTVRELMEEKLELQPPKEMNAAMQRGNDLEPIVRQMVNEKFGVIFTPCVFQSDKYPWMAASLDGLSDCGKFILEIKCPGIQNHEKIMNFDCPKHYLDQMLHQAFCVDLDVIYFVSYNPKHSLPLFHILHRPDKINQDRTIKLEEEFYHQLCTMQLPPEPWKFKGK